jgi:putative MATE family efflux protein
MNEAVFTRGSTRRHVLAMTGASAIGLMAMFGVDMIDMFFLTLLGEQELAAAVGFAGTLAFFLVAVSIGLQIALGALVARSEGAHRRDMARRYCSTGLIFNALVSIFISAMAWLNLPALLTLLGASGLTFDYALSYAGIMLPFMPVLVMGMSMASAVRAIGDARRSMWATIIGSLVNGLLDPLFIFTFGWGLEGAAWASVVARFAVLFFAWYALSGVHNLPCKITCAQFFIDIRPLLVIAAPAVLTNLATPLGNGFVLRTMAQFGDSAVAGAAIMGRITPVAFAAIFAMSGAVGPIVGQNAGAGLYTRVRSTLNNALAFVVVYVLLVWLLLWLTAGFIVDAFSASDQAAELIYFYTAFLAGTFVFNGTLFMANASFNNLRHPHWATGFNFGRTVFGTIPAVYFGAQWFGPKGVMAGEAVGSILFGICALIGAFALLRRLEKEHRQFDPGPLSSTEVAGLEAGREGPV